MATIREFFTLLNTPIYVKIEGHFFDFTTCPAHSRHFLQKYHLKDATTEFNTIKSHCGIDLQKYELQKSEMTPLLHGANLEKVRCMFTASEWKN